MTIGNLGHGTVAGTLAAALARTEGGMGEELTRAEQEQADNDARAAAQDREAREAWEAAQAEEEATSAAASAAPAPEQPSKGKRGGRK